MQLIKPARLVAVVAALCAVATSIVSAPPARAVDSSRTVDVLVVYTTEAKNDRGGASAMRAAISRGLDEMNNALQRSEIDAAVRLVGTMETSRESGPSHSADLNWLRNDAGVNDERDRVRADLVSMVVAGGAGLANRPKDPNESTSNQHGSIVGNDWLVPEPGTGEAGVFAHELGHNLGAAHDPQTSPPNNDINPYDRGYVSPRGQVDIMAYNNAPSCNPNCRRQPYFANPRITVNGESFGDYEVSDLARLFYKTVPKVAAYR